MPRRRGFQGALLPSRYYLPEAHSPVVCAGLHKSARIAARITVFAQQVRFVWLKPLDGPLLWHHILLSGFGFVYTTCAR
jgi:hypothetical protein